MTSERITNLSQQLARWATRPVALPPLVGMNWGGATPDEVKEAFGILAEHRLHLIVHSRLSPHDRAYLPRDLNDDLDATLKERAARQGMLELTFAHVTHTLHAAGIPTIACKGILLARDYYRPKGVRPMQDIDLWIPHAALDRVRSVLTQLGFDENPEKATNHALYFENPLGMLLDVHHQMALFETQGLDPFDLSVEKATGWCRAFRPEAQLVHLVYHLLGHTPQVAVLLGWVLDISVVLNEHGGRIDWGEVKRLCPTPRVWKILVRLIAFAAKLEWVLPPTALEPQIAAATPIHFATLVRLRHLAPLGLTSPRGWARLVKRIGTSDASRPPLPALAEFPRGLLELFSEGTRFARADCALLTGEESNRHH